MSKRRWRRPAVALASVAVALAALAPGVASARAEGIVPVEGGWVARTSAGLPVSFEVRAGQVVEAHFSFRWGFCGVFESALVNATPIDAAGHWKYLDGRGPWIEASFVAPDRAEGTVVAPSRELPGCPKTEASFVAAPGTIVPPRPLTFVQSEIGNPRLSQRPKGMVLTQDGSLYFFQLKWRNWGSPVAKANGRALLKGTLPRSGRTVTERPRVSVVLNHLVAGSNHNTYYHLRYVIHGKVPPGFRHRGGLELE